MRAELRGLPKTLADRVAQHLVAAGMLLDEDAEAGYAHAAEARRLAARVASTRESMALAAYLTGRYADALSEFRAFRRMTGAPEPLPLIADCERALGRPERALALLDEPDVPTLPVAERVELLIVCAGARRDLGDPAAAVVLLDIPELRGGAPDEEWVPRLRYAYADALLAADRRDDAVRWFARAAEADEEGETDAAERLTELTGG